MNTWYDSIRPVAPNGKLAAAWGELKTSLIEY